MDLGTMEYILDVVAGIKLDTDPNLMAAVAASGKS